jgi:hypothetical protein
MEIVMDEFDEHFRLEFDNISSALDHAAEIVDGLDYAFEEDDGHYYISYMDFYKDRVVNVSIEVYHKGK